MSQFKMERLCQQIVENVSDAIIFADREGIIRLWNEGAEHVFGYRAEEALGQTLDFIVPEHLRQRHWEGYNRVMATGVTKYGRQLLSVPAIRKDGQRISLEFSIALLRDSRGKVKGAAAVIRDVTARWQEQKVLKDRLAALEAKAKNPET